MTEKHPLRSYKQEHSLNDTQTSDVLQLLSQGLHTLVHLGFCVFACQVSKKTPAFIHCSQSLGALQTLSQHRCGKMTSPSFFSFSSPHCLTALGSIFLHADSGHILGGTYQFMAAHMQDSWEIRGGLVDFSPEPAKSMYRWAAENHLKLCCSAMLYSPRGEIMQM